MNLVFFGIEPHMQAPELFGVLATEGEMKWVIYDHLTEAMHCGEEIHIRQLNAVEKARVEEVLALYKVGEEISARIGSVLDVPADTERMAHAREASSGSVDDAGTSLSDGQGQAEA